MDQSKISEYRDMNLEKLNEVMNEVMGTTNLKISKIYDDVNVDVTCNREYYIFVDDQELSLTDRFQSKYPNAPKLYNNVLRTMSDIGPDNLPSACMNVVFTN